MREGENGGSDRKGRREKGIQKEDRARELERERETDREHTQ